MPHHHAVLTSITHQAHTAYMSAAADGMECGLTTSRTRTRSGGRGCPLEESSSDSTSKSDAMLFKRTECARMISTNFRLLAWSSKAPSSSVSA